MMNAFTDASLNVYQMMRFVLVEWKEMVVSSIFSIFNSLYHLSSEKIRGTLDLSKLKAFANKNKQESKLKFSVHVTIYQVKK